MKLTRLNDEIYLDVSKIESIFLDGRNLKIRMASGCDFYLEECSSEAKGKILLKRWFQTIQKLQQTENTRSVMDAILEEKE